MQETVQTGEEPVQADMPGVQVLLRSKCSADPRVRRHRRIFWPYVVLGEHGIRVPICEGPGQMGLLQGRAQQRQVQEELRYVRVVLYCVTPPTRRNRVTRVQCDGIG